MSRKKELKTLQEILDHACYTFSSLDFCQLCGGYDTIQTYIIFKDNRRDVVFHVCEKCCEQYKSETEIIKAYIEKSKKVVG